MPFFKAIATVGGLTMLSRIFGFLRDILTAKFLGAGIMADAFFVALKLPNFFRRLTAEGAFSVAFVPLFSKEVTEKGRDEAIRFAEETQTVMLTVLIPFTLLFIAAMPWVVTLVAPGFAGTPDRFEAAVTLSRVTFPYILLMSLTSLLGGVLNSFGRFGPFAAAPILFNFCLILALLFFADLAGSAGRAMAWGVAMAGIVQFLWLWRACRRMGVRLRLRRPRITARVRALFQKMAPAMLGAGVMQVHIFIDMVIASLLPVGAISYLYYADRLYQLPLSVVGIAVGTALLPMLTRALTAGDKAEATALFRQGFDLSWALAVPAMAAYFVLAPQIMQVLFVRGAFSDADGLQSALALMAYSLGLPAFVLAKLLSVAFFARHDTATPVRFAVIAAVLNTVLALALSRALQEQGIGHVGIALATGLTAWVNLALLAWALRRREGGLPLGRENLRRGLGVVFSALLMAGALWGLLRWGFASFVDGGGWTAFSALLLVMAAGTVVYGCGLLLTGAFSLSMLKGILRGRTDGEA